MSSFNKIWTRNSLLYITLGLCIFGSCITRQNFSVVPELSFLNIQVIQSQAGRDTQIVISMGFKDGDGDLGFLPTAQNGHDIFMTKFRKVNGAFVEIIVDTIAPYEPNSILLPYEFNLPAGITPTGTDKQIEGTIEIRDNFILDPRILGNDTVEYEVKIMDRARNFSNTIRSTTVIVTKP